MAETDFKYDVFVSYSSANKEWVRKTFVPILEKAGLKVCDYYRDFDVGAPIVMEMERAILESRKTIPVLSPAYLKSGWTEFESLMLQTLDAANRERKLLPVILETCELPLRISYLNCINFANPDDIEIEWQRLSRSLGVTLSSSLLETKSSAVSRDAWHLAHPYPMPPNFTGRAAELKMLDDWLADDKDRLFILRALGGFGKSTLAWQWINTHVNPAEWSKLVWWSFYEGDASFEHFIEETLKYLKLEIPQGQRPQVDELLKTLQSQKILLIMDGFERTLRAYSSMNALYQGDEEPNLAADQLDCVNIHAEIFLKNLCSLPNIKGRVLMTTRLTPNAVKTRGECLQGCLETELKEMEQNDAVAFFRLQGIKGTHAEIESVCASYGFHPLSLRILAGLISNDREKPNDIEVTKKLDITDSIIQNKEHVLKVSYEALSIAQQKLLSNIACFRSPINYEVLKIIFSKPSWKRTQKKSRSVETLPESLRLLETRGLLQWDRKDNRYDLHPIVRRYAYEQLSASERIMAHRRLRDYFATIQRQVTPKNLEEFSPVIELYHHTVRAEQYEDAANLFFNRLNNLLYYHFGAYQVLIELLLGLFPDGENELPKLRDERHQARIMSALGNSYGVSGQPRNAINLYQKALAIRKKRDELHSVGIILGATIMLTYIPLGMFKEAEKNLRLLIDLGKKNKDKFNEARGHLELGLLLAYKSDFDEAAQELDAAEQLFQDQNYVQSVGVTWAHRALRAFLIGDSQSMQSAAKRAREIANDEKNERDIIIAEWLLGEALMIGANDPNPAVTHLTQALTRCRRISLVEHEPDILLALARWHSLYGNLLETQAYTKEALAIANRCEYRLKQAEIHNFLARLALKADNNDLAFKEAEIASERAWCDGPPYYYKVAYHEAERLLESLKH
jgi:tetratricopeptide (TPR) repeat protein